jgi:hypothetical protein
LRKARVSPGQARLRLVDLSRKGGGLGQRNRDRTVPERKRVSEPGRDGFGMRLQLEGAGRPGLRHVGGEQLRDLASS